MAEVLITLGIIGIVASMTIPTLVKTYKNQVTISKLKKAYSVLNQGIRRAEADHGEFEYWENAFSIGPEAYMKKYWTPYFKVAVLCNSFKKCGYDSNIPYKHLSGSNFPGLIVHNSLRIPFITEDGIMYSVAVGSGGSGEHIDEIVPSDLIWVDINAGQGPNIIGKDVFFFTRVIRRGVMPYCYDYSKSSINANCKSTGTGTCCMQKIIQDNWDIKYDF